MKKKTPTPPVLHLVTTQKCMRNCKYCCNKQYDLETQVPTITKEELSTIEEVFLTGGEPVLFSNVSEIAKALKKTYSNIKRVCVYANATELALARTRKKISLDFINGFTISIKDRFDKENFEEYLAGDKELVALPSNFVYVFNGLIPQNALGFKIIERKWQDDFKPAENCIFRKMTGLRGGWVMDKEVIILHYR